MATYGKFPIIFPSPLLTHIHSYTIREPLDGEWGAPRDDGNWTGIVGTLQHHQADFCLGLTPNYARSRVVDFSRVYIGDPLVIISAKPRPLPNYLSLTRPFTGNRKLTCNS